MTQYSALQICVIEFANAFEIRLVECVCDGAEVKLGKSAGVDVKANLFEFDERCNDELNVRTVGDAQLLIFGAVHVAVFQNEPFERPKLIDSAK